MCLNDDNNSNNNNSNKSHNNYYRHANNLKDKFTHRNGMKRSTPHQRNAAKSTSTLTSTTAQRSVVKWKIIIPSIILLLCRSSHVHAIRKGRLMSPSSFTALSGDLHVQIQYSNEYDDETTTATKAATTTSAKPTSTPTPTTTRGRASAWHNQSHSSTVGSDTQTPSVVENTIMSTLVISKFIDEVTPASLPELGLHESENVSGVGVGAAAIADDDDDMNEADSSTREHLLQRKRKEIVQNIPLYPDPRNNVTQIAVPCQTFMRGGLYEMQVVTNLKTTQTVATPTTATSDNRTLNVTPTMLTTTTTLMPVHDERLRQTLDVRWPSAEMIVSPVRLRTYPENPVEVTLRFPEVNCERASHADDLPEFWLELVYCGKERSCAQLRPQNVSKANILYAEQVRGYPKSKTLKLKCELFGLAGNYAIQLRPLVPAPNVPITRRFLSVDWSDKFVFNVYARSIFPCDPHTGIGVLYEYPTCILEQGDRVRVYAKLRADVASLKPPTSLHYVAEQRVVKSQYSLYFNCDLFTEKYVEYCFVYVSQAISGAVADVRMDCVPTLPVSDSDTGGWGPWSEWTACSTNCLGGTRNRYRFCDSPPPRYGAKFCEGASVETEKCGKSISDTWDCIYETSGTNINKANRTEVSHEIGPGCRCGCIVHLGSSKPKRIIAGATQSCPGRSLWLIQVDGEETISLNLNFMRLPCATQYIKIRDGPSFSSTLLVQMNGGGIGLPAPTNDDGTTAPSLIESSGAQLLVEFFAGEEVTANATTTTTSKTASAALNAAMCTGGFMANVEQVIKAKNSSTTLIAAATRLSVKSRNALHKPKTRTKFTIVHLSAVVFASIIILISGLLGAQYVVRYRKYHLAIARRRDEGSRLHTPRESLTSLQSPPSRAVSTTTLLSEVIYMVKMRPKHQLRHSILRESVDAEQLARETEFNETGGHQQMVKCEENEEFGSNRSIVTLRNELSSPVTESHTPSSDEPTPSAAVCAEDVSKADDFSARSGTLTRKDSAKDSESIISSGMSSLCNSPPMNSQRLSKYSDRYDAVTLKIRNSRLDDSLQDSSSLRSGSFRLSQLGARSASASLTNGCYSPATSIVSTATIRTTNPKESKEKQNRRKLLARPGSEFSLGNQEDLELDYYDYNVINAGAAPGSYLGMDPAYLIWIPPFDEMPDEAREDDDKTPEPTSDGAQHEPESDETEPLYEEIKMPRYGHYLSPCSNTDSSISKSGKSAMSNTTDTTPTSDELSPLNSSQHSKATTPSETNHKNSLLQKTISAISGGYGKPATPYMTRKQRRQARQQSKSTHSLGADRETAFMRASLTGTKSAREIVQRETCTVAEDAEPNDSMSGSYVEKETSVVKSPSDLQVTDFLAIDDIQFADESESDHDPAATLKRQSAPETATRDLNLETAMEMQTRKSKLNDYARVPATKAREFAV